MLLITIIITYYDHDDDDDDDHDPCINSWSDSYAPGPMQPDYSRKIMASQPKITMADFDKTYGGFLSHGVTPKSSIYRWIFP